VVGSLILKAAGLEYSESEYFSSQFVSKKSWVSVFSVTYPEPSTLDCSITPKKIVYNESIVEFSGRLSTRGKGLFNMTIALEYSEDKGQTWHEISTARSGTDGTYKYAWTPNAGSYLVRSRWDGIKRKFIGAKSPSLDLAVDKGRVTMSVELSAREVPVNQNITFTCKLSKPMSTGTVTIDYSSDNKTWNMAGHGEVKSGTFILRWAPQKPGTYFIRVVWVGDQNYVEIPEQRFQIAVK